MYSQHSQPWGSQRLGFSNVDTISQYGCYVSVMAEIVAGYARPGYNPENMNNDLKAHGLFVQGDLVANDSVLHTLFPATFGSPQVFNYQRSAADLSHLSWSPNEAVIIEVDFDHNPTDGIQTHFLLVKSWDGRSLLVGDPWYGTVDNFAKNYGSNLAQTIIKIIRYPILVAPAPAPEPPPPPPPPAFSVTDMPQRSVIITAAKLSVRTGPGTSYPRAAAAQESDGLLHANDSVRVDGFAIGDEISGSTKTNKWFRSAVNHGHFFSAAWTNFVEVAPPPPAPEPAPPAPEPTPEPVPEPVPAPPTPEPTPEPTTMIKDLVDAEGKPGKLWVQAKTDTPIIKISTTGVSRKFVPAGTIFPVTRMKSLGGNVYYQTDKMRLTDPDTGIRFVDVQTVDNPELSALAEIANLHIWDKFGAAFMHWVSGEGFKKWFFAKSNK